MAAYDQRVALDFRFGQLSGGVDALGTTLASPTFASLPSDLSTTRYIPITLADDSQGLYEVVWVTGHSAGSTSVTVVRGREGSSARTWGAGTLWRHGPTARDALPQVATRAALPSDGHLGMRAGIQNEDGTVVEKTPTGWSDRPGAGRKHGWKQTGASAASGGSDILVSGWTADSGNPTIATMSAGNLLLNRPGLWALRLMAYSDVAKAGRSLIYLKWPSGAFLPNIDSEASQEHRQSPNYAKSGELWQRVFWSGYVTAAQAAQVIQALVNQTTSDGTAVSYNFYLTAELLGA